MKNTLLTVGIVIALILGGIAITKTPNTIVGGQGTRGEQGLKGDKGDVGPRGLQGERGPAGSNSSGVKLGAVASPDIPSPYIRYGDVRTWQYKQPFQQGTTTICSIPVSIASSTLIFADAQPTVSTSTAYTFTATKSVNLATSTGIVLATSIQVANARESFIIATTTPVADTANGRATITDRNFNGNATSYLNVSVTGGVGGFDIAGQCTATFRELY
jgi:hypothetical protein